MFASEVLLKCRALMLCCEVTAPSGIFCMLFSFSFSDYLFGACCAVSVLNCELPAMSGLQRNCGQWTPRSVSDCIICIYVRGVWSVKTNEQHATGHVLCGLSLPVTLS